MKRLRILIIGAWLVFGLVGCASLQKAASEVTPEQQAQMTQQIATTAGPFIPQPYQLPATVALGWIACVAYNWFKDKTKPKV